MLAYINRIRSNRMLSESTIRTLTSNDTSTSHGSARAAKQAFANDKLQEKVQIEYIKSQKRIFTVPNILTLSRIATSPAIGYFIWTGAHSHALACFAFAATTDFLDGFIARRFNQSSDVGAVLDPIADKLLLTTCFVAMCCTDLMPIWLVKGFIMRDVIIVSGAAVLRYNGFDERPNFKKFFDFKNNPTLGLEPTLISKINTALQCLLVVLHLSGPSYSLLPLQLLTASTSVVSISQYGARMMKPNFWVRAPKLKV